MTTKICDWDPCDPLKHLVLTFLDPSWKEGEDIKLRVLTRGRPEDPIQTAILFLEYCPFCGTGITDDDGVYEWVAQAAEYLRRNPGYTHFPRQVEGASMPQIEHHRRSGLRGE